MSFNDFKNHTQILKKYLMRMNSISESEIKPQWIDQSFLKENNPHIFLQILHYVLIKFSPSTLFVKVLDFYPTIKDDNDKKFVSNTLSLSRKMLQIDVKIDIDQFLSAKFVEKKTQFASTFCKAAYEFHQKQAKSTSNFKVGTATTRKEGQFLRQVPQKIINRAILEGDSDEENPRNLNLVPSNPKRPIIRKQDMEESSEDEDLKELMIKKQELTKIKQVSKEPPKIAGKNMNRVSENVNRVSESQKIQQNLETRHQNNTNKVQSPKKEQENESQTPFNPDQYVTRQEFMEIVTGMSKNFTQLLTKFNDFQRQVSGWVQNVNAKISILQENVKTIKNNL